MQGYDETDEYSRMHPANVPTQFSKRKLLFQLNLSFMVILNLKKPF